MTNVRNQNIIDEENRAYIWEITGGRNFPYADEAEEIFWAALIAAYGYGADVSDLPEGVLIDMAGEALTEAEEEAEEEAQDE